MRWHFCLIIFQEKYALEHVGKIGSKLLDLKETKTEYYMVVIYSVRLFNFQNWKLCTSFYYEIECQWNDSHNNLDVNLIRYYKNSSSHLSSFSMKDRRKFYKKEQRRILTATVYLSNKPTFSHFFFKIFWTVA
jgi:hypothetical protein